MILCGNFSCDSTIYRSTAHVIGAGQVMTFLGVRVDLRWSMVKTSRPLIRGGGVGYAATRRRVVASRQTTYSSDAAARFDMSACLLQTS